LGHLLSQMLCDQAKPSYSFLLSSRHFFSLTTIASPRINQRRFRQDVVSPNTPKCPTAPGYPSSISH
jgi:hypothetical protein